MQSQRPARLLGLDNNCPPSVCVTLWLCPSVMLWPGWLPVSRFFVHHTHTHTRSHTNHHPATDNTHWAGQHTASGGILLFKKERTHINGPTRRLEHRLSIKECIRRTQGSDIETVCAPLERDFMSSGGQWYWVRAHTDTNIHHSMKLSKMGELWLQEAYSQKLLILSLVTSLLRT